MEDESNILNAALRYAAAGVAVFPTRLYVRGDGKKGVQPIADWDSASSTDPETIRGWFTGAWQDGALCIDCGKSGIVGVDQDVTEGKDGRAAWSELDPPATWRVRSPTGGAHDYYRADPNHPFTVDNTGAVAEGVDIRGMGGFLFAPPSIDPRGGSWQWVEGEPDWPALPMVPEVVIKRMEGAAAGKRAKAPARLDPIERRTDGSQLFTNGVDFGPGGGRKKESKARALLTARLEEFLNRTQEGSARSHFLAQDLGVLAGHGVEVFWTYAGAHETLMEAARDNGMVGVHGETYVADQARRGLEYGMRQLWTPEDESAPVPPGTDGDEPVEDSWAPVDITSVLSGEHRQVVPELGRRSDGIRILYPGKEHAIASEPECGKTWWVMLQVKSVLEEGGCVVYIDFEDDEGTIVGRLMSLGIDHDLLKPDRFRYVRPDVRPPAGVVARLCTFGDDFARLVILDGMTEGLGLMGLSALDQEAIVEWRKTFVKPAMRGGAATLTTDHVVKAADNRGRYAIGAQHKLAGLNGVMFTMSAYKPFGQGLDGISSVFITKDRNGGLRRQGKQAEGITEIGALHGVCSDGRNKWSFRPPLDKAPAQGVERYPGLDKKFHSFVKPVLEYIKANQNHSYTTIRENVKGSNAAIGTVLRWLTDKQALATQSGQGGGRLYALDTFVASTLDIEAAVLDGIRTGLFPTD